MSIPSYPAELPPPLRADYAEQSGEGRILFRPDAGPSRPGNRFASVVDLIPFSTRLKRWQLEVFDRFYLDETKRGSLPFTMPAPFIDGYEMLDENLEVLLDENFEPLLYPETMLVMFAEQGLPARSSIQADAFNVSFRLSRLPV